MLARLLDQALADPARRATLAADLDRLFGREGAVLVVDLCGFSRLTFGADISEALLEIRRLQVVGDAATQEEGGRLVKAWADNLMCIFPDVASAQRAARRIVAAIPSGAGIGYGRILDLGSDLQGADVIAACKLGEDVAGPGEVLLTPAAQAATSPAEEVFL